MTFADMQSTRLRVELKPGEHTFDVAMVEGSVRSLDARVQWQDDCIRLTIDLDLNSPMPGVLARELEVVYPARLLSALLAEDAPVVAVSL